MKKLNSNNFILSLSHTLTLSPVTPHTPTLPFSPYPPPNSLPHTHQVGSVDFEYARILRSTIKLVGTASLNKDGSLAVFVSPMMVPLGIFTIMLFLRFLFLIKNFCRVFFVHFFLLIFQVFFLYLNSISSFYFFSRHCSLKCQGTWKHVRARTFMYY